MISQQHERSAEDCAVGKRDGVAVKIDRAIVRQTCDCTIAGQRPGAAGLDGHDRVARDRCAALGIIGNIDRAGEAATVLKRQVQRRDRVDEDVAVQDGAGMVCPCPMREALIQRFSSLCRFFSRFYSARSPRCSPRQNPPQQEWQQH